MPDHDLLDQDAANRNQALELDSFIVEAPAGAGKTELLTQRFLRLLQTVREPEEIVAITFTNKAAAEMRGRILNNLQCAAAGDVPEQPHKRITYDLALRVLARSQEAGWALLTQPERLRINTIDSLNSLLARQMPLMSRFGAQPAVNSDATEHYREAARRALAMLEDENDEGPVTQALRYLDNDVERLAELLAEMLARREQWLHHAGRESVQAEVELALAHLLRQDIMQAALVLTPTLQAELMPVARYAASSLASDHPIAALADWDETLPEHPAALPLWRGVCELLLTQQGEFRKSCNVNQGFPPGEESKPYKQALADIIGAMPSPLFLARIRHLPNWQSTDEERRIVGSLACLLQLAAAHLWTVFQEAGEVDFVEVAHRALGALEDESGPTDLALRLDYQIQHLLVDEFQDTSPQQVELLRRLTLGWEAGDGRTLFCVGDPMQSIYRFRKADVGLFLHAAQFGIGQVQLQRLQLTRNNRSSPEVVDWVNRAFEQVFPQQDSITRGAIRYRPFAAARQSQPDHGVMVHPLVLAPECSNVEVAIQEARLVANLIEQERAQDAGRRIAVLVRARTHLEALVAEIRRHHPQLPFQAVEIEQLAGRQAIQDVLSLTHAMFHRADRVHWLAVLRAPWCGLMLADMHALAADDHDSTLWQLMQDEHRLAGLSEDGRQRLLHVRGVIAESFAHQGRQSARRWVESAWLRLGGPYCLWEAGDVRDVQAYFSLIEQIGSNGLFDMARLEMAVDKLYAAPDAVDGNSPQFMTIHKSKGLEFDTVILPGLHRAPKTTDAPLLLWEDIPVEQAGPQLIAAPWVPKSRRDGLPGTYEYLQGLERERTANEAARMLYVAATRTQCRLHLVGAVRPDSKGDIKPPANTFLSLLWDTLGDEFLRSGQVPQALPGITIDESTFVPGLVRLQQPSVPSMLAGTTVPVSLSTSGDQRAGRGDLAADCGTLAHRYLEMIANGGLEQWHMQRVTSLQPAMQRWLVRQGHAEKNSTAGAGKVAAALCRTLDSADGQWVLKARENSACELELACSDGAGISTHVVDRTFVEDGVRWVIDYKSADFGNDASEELLQLRAEDYRLQLERYARLFEADGLPVHKAVLFLVYGRLIQLD